jgi:TonB family protein
LSLVFDARKRAELSKVSRETSAGAPGPADPGAHSSGPNDASPAKSRTQDLVNAKAAAAEQRPLVRSLLRLHRPDPGSAAPRSSLAGTGEPAIVVLPSDPIYPAVAKQQLIGGSVEVLFRISSEGNVYGVRSVKGPPILAQAAIKAVENGQYGPARLNGACIDSQVTARFDFKLD